MKFSELFAGVEILETNAPRNMELAEVRYVSGEVQHGDAFIAVPGFVTDGHQYIESAIAAGAALIICEHSMPKNTPWVRVGSTRETLAKLGANRFGHPARAMQVIGVTGTNGKTSVTYLLKTLLERVLGARVGLIGTICNLIGDVKLATERTTPESYELQRILAQMRDAGCTHVVMEVSSHALFLHRVDEIPFCVGAFTNLSQDHLDFHKTMQAYCEAKARLFRRCKHGVFNLDDAAAQDMMANATCDCLSVGTAATATLRAERISYAPDAVQMNICRGEQRLPLHLGIPGHFTVSNALITLGVAVQLGIPLTDAVAGLSAAKGVKGRVEVVPTPGCGFTVLIDYAHTPDGLENVLRSVREFCRGRLIVVFGCGGDRDKTKRPIMGEIALKYADYAFITSDNPRTEDPNAIIEDILQGVPDTGKHYTVVVQRREAIRKALRFAAKNDMIVLAGKGHETYQILATGKIHFDEREEVASALCERN